MFNLTFNYTPGRQNSVADTLSRPPNNQHTIEYMYVSIDFPRKGAEDFRKAQLENDYIKTIIKSFENNDENVIRYTSRGFIMLDGILY